MVTYDLKKLIERLPFFLRTFNKRPVSATDRLSTQIACDISSIDPNRVRRFDKYHYTYTILYFPNGRIYRVIFLSEYSTQFRNFIEKVLRRYITGTFTIAGWPCIDNRQGKTLLVGFDCFVQY